MNDDQDPPASLRLMEKRLDNEAARLRRGFVRAHVLPAATWFLVILFGAITVRQFCIQGTFLDATEAAKLHGVSYDANRDYADGDLDAAAAGAAKILARQPNHALANQLMARIELGRGHREAALACLRRALETSLNRDEVEKWIAGLEAAPVK
jgi:enoyl-CoA hydratase/carnithine racemase